PAVYYKILRELREDNNLSQFRLTQVLKFTRQTYSRYKNRQNELPIPHLIALFKFYGVAADCILGLSHKNNHSYHKTTYILPKKRDEPQKFISL
ncbi:MAG: helix-turn-helix transcriptional regulator, partial [Christensenellaceae bacterium]